MKNALALIAAAALVPIQPASAQDAGTIRIRAGIGGETRPEFIGAEGNEWAPLFDLAIAKDGEPFSAGAPDDNFAIKLVKSGGFTFGPVANIQSGRKDKDVGIAIGRIKTTIEGGAFAQYQLSDSLRLRGEVRKGFGGHRGVVASLGGDYVWRDGDRYVISLGPRLLLSDGRYQRAWFGVSPQASLATDLPEYRPGGGIHAVAATSGAHVAISKNFGLFGFARYERLIGDAAKSPFIREYGSRNQASAGLGLTYTFSVRR
jgi:outer membrane protein